ncbi:MAG: amidohydrolase [Chitinophagia bacterium]|jgi:amidohydrolase|nr:amidohydrolase [Chitinophagia bacterium]
MRNLLILILISFQASAQTVPAQLPKYIQDVNNQLIEMRRYFHQNPELSNREFKTAEKIEAYLKEFGIPTRRLAKTGVVGILKGGKPGAVVGLRADIDALPVTERNDLPYRSKATAEYNGQSVGVMHACGHDTHIAMLLGTAKVLSQLKNEVPGTVVFIFQPAEEGPPANEEGGAPLMIKEGLMDNPKIDAVFGIHIKSNIELGKIGYKSGGFMASSDWFSIKVKGKQTHGANPWLGIDPIVVSAAIIQNLQTIVSRQSELTKAPAVITVGIMNAGVRPNIIPEEAVMSGTIRTLDADMQQDIHKRIRQTVNQTAAAFGASAEVTIDTKTLVTYNNPALVSQSVPSLKKALGEKNVWEINWDTGAEDFSFYGSKAPSFFMYLGAKNPAWSAQQAFPHHTPDFMLDDSQLDAGVKVFCQLVFDFVKPH